MLKRLQNKCDLSSKNYYTVLQLVHCVTHFKLFLLDSLDCLLLLIKLLLLVDEIKYIVWK